jgi:5-methylcytosine-specific restriction protein A
VTGRTVKEWQGRTPDSKIPDRVRTRIFDRAGGVCHLCKLPIKPAETWDADHVRAIINGGANAESNLAPAHKHCHLAKTRADVAEKAKVAAKRRKNDGRARPPSKLRSRNDLATGKVRAPKQPVARAVPIYRNATTPSPTAE